MADFAEVLNQVAANEGITVSVKTDLGPEFVVYDATKPPGGIDLVKFGVRVRTNSGKVIGSYGDYPQTNWIKVASLLGAVAVVAVAIFRGVR